jgi:hypothetical protein
MARQDVSTATAAAMAAYEARDKAKAGPGRRNPIYGYSGLVLLLLGIALYFGVKWWINRPPPLDAPPQVLAAYMASSKFDAQSTSTQQHLRDAFSMHPEDQQRAAVEALNEDQRDAFEVNRRPEADPTSEREKRFEQMQKDYLAAGTSEEKRALMEKMFAERRAQWQARATSQPTSMPSGQGGPPGGPGGGGPGGGRGGPGGGFGPGGGNNPTNRAMGGEMRINGREMRAERGH